MELLKRVEKELLSIPYWALKDLVFTFKSTVKEIIINMIGTRIMIRNAINIRADSPMGSLFLPPNRSSNITADSLRNPRKLMGFRGF